MFFISQSAPCFSMKSDLLWCTEYTFRICNNQIENINQMNTMYRNYQYGGRMRFSFIIAICITAVVVTFSLQNSQKVQVQFLGWYFEGAMVLVLLMTFVIGALTMFFLSLPSRLARRRELKDLRRQLESVRRDAARSVDNTAG
jgi:uncharacterized integral membrane protein